MNDRQQQRMVRLTARPTEPEASILVSVLEREGIRAVMTGQFTAGFKAEAPGWVAIHVFESELEPAKRILRRLEDEEREPFDWKDVDVGSPSDH